MATDASNSFLTTDLDSLRRAVVELYYGGGVATSTFTFASDLNADEQDVVDRMIDSGLMQFYNPPPDPRTGRVHEWSFLRPVTTLAVNAPITAGTITYTHTNRRVVFTTPHGLTDATAPNYKIRIDGIDYEVDSRHDDDNLVLPTTDNPGANITTATAYKLHQDDYNLPDDFGRIMGKLTFTQKDNAWYTVEIIGEDRIRELRQRNVQQNYATGDPQFGAIVPIENDPTIGTRQQIWFWPSISASATLQYRYRARPTKLTTSNKYPWGVTDHAATILASCLAEAELRLDGERGPYWQKFMESLVASIQVDNRDNRPIRLGYNEDHSDARDIYSQSRDRRFTDAVSYNRGDGQTF